ncbi:MAG: alpha-2-macroglobulin family protein [Fimbriiglobus sp.]
MKTWSRNNNGGFNPGPAAESDKNGLFINPGGQNQGWLVLAAAGGNELASANDHYSHHQPGHRAHGQTVLFTDRAIYRPGQTVRFKGIALHVDQNADKYEVIPNKPVAVRFADPNGKEIAKLDLQTNEYGSFNGSFTAPRDRLTGQMTIQVTTNNLHGVAQVRVEEYTRPQFLAELDAPKEPAKLGENATVTGRATAYTGAAVGGAKIKYRVAREVQFPQWWYEFYWWRIPPNRGASQEVAHGTATTAADGSFSVTFPAKPDKTVAEKDEPIFIYTVTADVTDTNGETRTATRTVRVGYTALAATVTADPWQVAGTKVKLTVTTQSHDGEGQAAKGTVKIYALKQPETPVRPDILGRDPSPVRPFRGRGKVARARPVDPTPDPSDPKAWALGEVVATLPFTTDPSGKTEVSADLPAGPFRAVVETTDKFGKAVSARTQITVLDPAAKALAVKVPNLFAAPKWTLEPGAEFSAVWGTGYAAGRAFVEVEHRGKVVQSYWTDAGRTQATVTQKIDESMRGGFTVRVTAVRENRAYLEARHVDVPWTNKNLTVKWERFVSKLEPAQKETFTAVVTGPDAKRAVAEMVATLYDASLDAYQPHNWMARFNVFRQDNAYRHATFENQPHHLYQAAGQWHYDFKNVGPITYRKFPDDITVNLWQYDYAYSRVGKFSAPGGEVMPMAAMAPKMSANRALEGGVAMEAAAMSDGLADSLRKAAADPKSEGEDKRDAGGLGGAPSPGPDLSKVSARTNLSETAFFFPHLVSDNDGVVRMEFTMPEALTKWKFLGFAHDKDLRSGQLTGETVTAKDLMVQPNPPRFLREGDVIEFVAKVTNQSAGRQAGTVRLTLTDARTGKPIDAEMGNTTPDLSFDVPTKEARSIAWRLTVPDGQGPVIYKVVGASDRLSDGEEGMVPVLSKRVYVTESLPLPIRGNQTRKFEFEKFLGSGKSDTLKTQALTVQMTSNPSWYAVMALPYLMEFPHECSEQTFNRLYANALARHVAASDPKIRRVFDQWKGTPALNSPLEKNQDLKAVILDETPWVRDAQKESQARRNVGVLFDEVRLNDETGRLVKKLADMQHGDGAWPWFPGGPANDYITLYIATGFGRVRHLGVKLDAAPAVKAVARLDTFAVKLYQDVLKFSKHKDENHLSPTVAMLLYGRSFFLKDVPVPPAAQEAYTYWQGQAKKHWLALANRQSQAHIAVGLKRFGDAETPKAILASVKERSVTDDEMGMFWRDTELNLWWYRAPIETQAMMIEALDEVLGDAKAVEECKIWLLKQKQTRDWKTTKATADAVYALLLRGDNLLKSDGLVEVSLAGEQVKPEAAEAGTGFFEEKFVRNEVKPDMGRVEVKNPNPGVAWGSVHWQYLEDVSKVTPHQGTPLKVEKKLFKKVYTKAGPTLEPITGTVQVGDEIVTRVVIRTDRDMEYVHLKDHRGSGTEPVNVLSKYKYQDGLAYYEATRDTSTDFFIDYLPKGVYVFEYPVRVQHRGKYPTGLATAQCMYAPEFNSHSESVPLEAK